VSVDDLAAPHQEIIVRMSTQDEKGDPLPVPRIELFTRYQLMKTLEGKGWTEPHLESLDARLDSDRDVPMGMGVSYHVRAVPVPPRRKGKI
jgi:hypothetical protein